MPLDASFKQSLMMIQIAMANYERGEVSRNVAPDDDMAHRSWDKNLTAYFGAGRASLEIILHGLFLCGSLKVDTILSMPSGYGRELRHIKVAFPQAKIVACDLYRGRVDYCVHEFGAEGVLSKENFDEIEFDRKFDLIWVGSLLTHIPEPLFSKALALCSRSLARDGVALVTFQGRHAPFIQKNRWKFMADDKFASAETEYRKCGFGYADYGMQDIFNAQKHYGISLSAPWYITRILEQDDSIQIYGLMERRWDNCQDVVIFKKRSINA